MRDQRIDFIKGMLMWCVVYGHIINVLLIGIPHPPICLHTFVRTFDMPFFMILSGYFLKKSLEKRSRWNVFINRVSMIFVPIVIWTLLFCRISFVMYYFLWAVLVSSIICIVGNKMSACLPGKIGRCLELLLYFAVVILLHAISIPWNLFYLFPFFVFGYYMRDVRFELTRRAYCIMGVVFVVLLCFWNTSYTPWHVGTLAWKENSAAVLVYVYRLMLGIIGVYVMAKFFDVIRNLLSDNSFIVQTVAGWGKETLSLYIMQSIVVEGIFKKACEIGCRHCLIDLSQTIVNLVGYVAAPILSFFAIGIMALVVRRVKCISMVRYAFGFKVNESRTK